MKREDFKKITKKHIESCKKIIRTSKCNFIQCRECPFSENNSTKKIKSCTSRYSYHGIPACVDLKLIRSAKKFLKLFEKDFLERKIFEEEEVIAELKKLKRKKFVKQTENHFIYWDNENEEVCYGSHRNSEHPMLYFYSNNIMEIVDNIKKYKMTKELFFEAYKKAFGKGE